MKKIDEAIGKIRTLECPTGDLENRVTEILENYGVADRSKINVNRDEYFDKDEAQAYRVQILNQEHLIMVLAKSGYDDYVAKVTDVY